MAISTDAAARAAHILLLMKQGDDAFNRQNIAAMDAAHHPDMIAYVTGSDKPLQGREEHAAAMQRMFRAFPMFTSTILIRSSLEMETG